MLGITWCKGFPIKDKNTYSYKIYIYIACNILIIFLFLATIIGESGAVGVIGRNFANFNTNLFGYLAYIYLLFFLYPAYRLYKDPHLNFRKIELSIAGLLGFASLLLIQSLLFASGVFGNNVVSFLQRLIGNFGVWILSLGCLFLSIFVAIQSKVDVLVEYLKKQSKKYAKKNWEFLCAFVQRALRFAKDSIAYCAKRLHKLMDFVIAAYHRRQEKLRIARESMIQKEQERLKNLQAVQNLTEIKEVYEPAKPESLSHTTQERADTFQAQLGRHANQVIHETTNNADAQNKTPEHDAASEESDIQIVPNTELDAQRFLQEQIKHFQTTHAQLLQTDVLQPHLSQRKEEHFDLIEEITLLRTNEPLSTQKPQIADTFALHKTFKHLHLDNMPKAPLDIQSIIQEIPQTPLVTEIQESTDTQNDLEESQEKIKTEPKQETKAEAQTQTKEEVQVSIKLDSTEPDSYQPSTPESQPSDGQLPDTESQTFIAQDIPNIQQDSHSPIQSPDSTRTLAIQSETPTQSGNTPAIDLRSTQVVPSQEQPPMQHTISIQPEQSAPNTPGQSAQSQQDGKTHTIVRELDENTQLLKNLDFGKTLTPLNFKLPLTSLLNQPDGFKNQVDEVEIDTKSEILLAKLKTFKIDGDVVRTYSGPIVTTFEFRPAPNVKVSRILNLEDDLALALSAKSIRIQAPVPGKDVVGIEIPNNKTETIYLREVLESDLFKSTTSSLTLAFGKDIVGNPFVQDLRKLPHLLIAGTTGSGKSVGINAMILSLLYKNSPDNLKLMMIDPKRVEFSLYADIPHLITPIITDPKKAINGLISAMREMDRRYEKMKDMRVKEIESYNKKAKEEGEECLSYFVIIIDELADLMQTSGREAEAPLSRIAQMGRACGIHLIIATQRPSVDVVTGTLKGNLPSRISYKVGSKVDSKVILDSVGAESLLGKGDMLFKISDTMIRLHAPFSTEEEIERVVEFIKSQKQPEYDKSFLLDDKENILADKAELQEDGDMLEQIKRFMLESGNTSSSSVQRRFSIGFNRATNYVEQLEKEGFLSKRNAKGVREIIGA